MSASAERFKDIRQQFEGVLSDGGADIDADEGELFGGTPSLRSRFRSIVAVVGRTIARTQERAGFRTWLALLYKRRETLGEGRIFKGHSPHLEEEVRDLQLSQIKAPAKGRPQIAKAATDVHNAFEADPVLKGRIDQGLLELIQQLSRSGPGKVRRGEPGSRHKLVEEILARWRPRPPQSKKEKDRLGPRRGRFVGEPGLTFPLLLHFSENAKDLRRCCRLTPAKRSQELDRIEARIMLERHGHMIVSPAPSNRFVVLPGHLAIYRTLTHSTVRCSVRKTFSRRYVHIYEVCSVSIELCKVLEAEAFEREERREVRRPPSVRSARPRCAAWLKKEMRKRGDMTSYGLHKDGGPDPRTIDKILRGEPVSKRTLGKVVVGLSHKGPRVVDSDIPED